MIKITLSGEIGWDVWPEMIKEQLTNAGGKDIEVHMVSPGGSVYDGIEIFNMFRDYKRDNPDSQNILMIKGMVASMATYIAMCPAFDLVVAEDNSTFMIHNAWGSTSGDYREMKLFSEILNGLTGLIADVYVKKTGKKKAEIREMMDSETWLFGGEIKKAGFIDEMIPSDSCKKKKSKAEAMAMAKMTYGKLSDKMKTADNNIDVNKIAAMIKPEPEKPEIAEDIAAGLDLIRADTDKDFTPEIRVVNIDGKKYDVTDKAQTPAQRDNNNTEVIPMTLAQLMAENPAAKIEHEKALEDNFKAGIIKGEESAAVRMKAAAAFLGPDSVYPGTIKSLAIDVLEGKQTPDSLRATASAFDALKESQNSESAAAESKASGETPGEQVPNTSENGEIENELDFSASVKAHRKARGSEV